MHASFIVNIVTTITKCYLHYYSITKTITTQMRQKFAIFFKYNSITFGNNSERLKNISNLL